MFHGADDVGLHTLHIHARLRGERHRHQALVRRVKLLQRGGVQNGIRNDHLVAVALAHDGLTPIDVLDGAGDAGHLDVIARLDDAAKHKPEAADHIGDRILQTQRNRKTADAKRREQGGRIDAEHRLQQRADGEHPHHHAQDVDEDGCVRHLRFVEHAAHHLGERLVDKRGDDEHDGEQDELAVVFGKPVHENFNWIHGCLVYTGDVAQRLRLAG